MKRNSIEVTTSILEVALSGANTTKIVYKSNLNFEMAQRYLKKMNHDGLIEKNGSEHRTTDKGKEFIKRAKALLDL